MSAKLILSISQLDEKVKPYTFKMTNIKVYSFEEALYHCYKFWKQSIDDFLSGEFISWVLNSLNLTVIASKIRELSNSSESFSSKFISFITIADYFEHDKIETIKRELDAWGKRNEWEKLKERGDYLMDKGDYEKACIMYKKAASFYPENAVIHNNIAISLMKQGLYSEAAGYLFQSLAAEPENVTIMLHLSEALLLKGDYDKAREFLKKAEKYGGKSVKSTVACFYGQIELFSGNYMASIPYFESAIAQDHDPHYIYCLSEVYVRLRQYDKAFDTIKLVKVKDKIYLKKLADMYVTYNNIPAAIKCIETALASENNNVDLWTILASYYRLDYDLTKAYNAIIKALSISKANFKANLEFARIRKAQGMIKDYQAILNGVLNGFKENYRENMSI